MAKKSKKEVVPSSSSEEEPSSSSSSSKESSSSSSSSPPQEKKKPVSSSSSSSSDEEEQKTKESSSSSSSEEIEIEEDTKPASKKRVRDESEEKESKPAKKQMTEKSARANEIFVGSLPFNTTEDELKALFQEEGATVTRVGILNNGGAAFIAFSSDEEAQAQLKWNQTTFKGRTLRVNMAGDKPKPGDRAASPREGGAPRDRNADRDRTVFVGGLPFETTDVEMKKLFTEEGHNVERVNMISNGACAFVIFGSEKEAKENLKWDGSKYGGRTIRVNMAGDKPAGKGRK